MNSSLKARTPIVRAAAVGAIISLLLMIWSLLDPRPMPVVVAMSVGQMIGTVSLGAFLVVLAKDLRRASRKIAGRSSIPPSPPSSRADLSKIDPEP